MVKYKRVSAIASLVLLVFSSTPLRAIEIDPDATIKDSPTTLMGVNHIGLSVKNLDSMLAFYQKATGFKVVRRESVRNNKMADELFGQANIAYEVAVLEAPNMLFELVEFSHNADAPVTRMPVQGPGMTHTCFQTPASDSGYYRFKAAGADILSLGDSPVDLGGYGVTYAYGYDPEGNMLEMEQLDPGPLAEVPAKVRWIGEGHTAWMTQVALVTHDIERLTNWYENILAFKPYRLGDYDGNPRIAETAGRDYVSLLASWFRLNDRTKTLEFWQFRDPVTTQPVGKREITGLGYSYSIEVGDIQAEFDRMSDLGVAFVSAPVDMGDYWQVYAHDVDGNVFALRQWQDPDSPYSIPNLEQ